MLAQSNLHRTEMLITKSSVEAMRADWSILECRNSQTTLNMASLCSNKSGEHCFLLRPPIGSRKLDLVGSQFTGEIRDMVFVAENVVLIKLSNGRCVTFFENGLIK